MHEVMKTDNNLLSRKDIILLEHLERRSDRTLEQIVEETGVYNDSSWPGPIEPRLHRLHKLGFVEARGTPPHYVLAEEARIPLLEAQDAQELEDDQKSREFGREEQEQETKTEFEVTKHMIDFVRHLATLCSGGLLAIAGFMEKLFSNPQWKILLGISLVGFAVSVMGCVIYSGFLFFRFGEHEYFDKCLVEDWRVKSASLAAFGGFTIGIVALLAFAIVNLFAK